MMPRSCLHSEATFLQFIKYILFHTFTAELSGVSFITSSL